MWQDYFKFSKSQRRGIFILLSLIVILLSVNAFLYYSPTKQESLSDHYQDSIREFEAKLKQNDSGYYAQNHKLDLQSRYDSLLLFPFDPNTMTRQEARQLGFSEKHIKAIETYKRRGKRFHYNEDIVWLIGEAHHSFLKDHITLPHRPARKHFDFQQEKAEERTDSLFAFYPQTATETELIRLGFSKRQVNNIINYRQHYPIRSKTDFKKIYAISTNDYARYEPYLRFDQRTEYQEDTSPEEQPAPLDLNTATADDLKTLPGIGHTFSQRIVKYRDILGGYASKEQLLEVYNFPPETYQRIKSMLTVNTKHVKKLRINFMEKKELSRHPYISYQQAQKIVDYRTKHGSYRQIEDVKRSKAFTEEEFTRLKPYLKL